LENQSSFIQENNIPAFGAVEITWLLLCSDMLSMVNWYSSAFSSWFEKCCKPIEEGVRLTLSPCLDKVWGNAYSAGANPSAFSITVPLAL